MGNDVPLKDSATLANRDGDSRLDVSRTALVVPTFSTRNEKRAWQARQRYARDPAKFVSKRRQARAKARDRGRCGCCVTRYCEPGYKTCITCLENAKRYAH